MSNRTSFDPPPSRSRGLLSNLKRSTILRVSLTYLAIFAFGITVLGGYVYWHVSSRMLAQIDAHIESEVEALAEIYRDQGSRGLIAVIDERLARTPDRSSVYLLQSASGRWLTGNVSKWPVAAPDDRGWMEFNLYDRSAGESTTARVRPFRLRGGARLLVGRDISDVAATTALIKRALVIGILATFATVVICALFFSWSSWRKLNSISVMSRQVMAGDLSRRIAITDEDSDLADVSGGLNAMLDEIQNLIHGIERVSDNIAHDLRTPLARIRNRLSVAFETSHDTNANGAIAAAIEEVDRLILTFNALLRIARLENGSDVGDWRRCDLHRVVDEAIDLYRPVAEQRGITFVVSGGPAVVDGEPQLLSQAICNVIDNAMKFSPTGSSVSVDVSEGPDTVTVEVADHGPGIDAVDLPRVADRFYRADSARQTPGSGLGLSLVSAISNAHGAKLTLEDNKPGLRVSIEFPAARAACEAA